MYSLNFEHNNFDDIEKSNMIKSKGLVSSCGNKKDKDQYMQFTLQEMCCGFLLSREMWYRKSVLPGTGAG